MHGTETSSKKSSGVNLLSCSLLSNINSIKYCKFLKFLLLNFYTLYFIKYKNKKYKILDYLEPKKTIKLKPLFSLNIGFKGLNFIFNPILLIKITYS